MRGKLVLAAVTFVAVVALASVPRASAAGAATPVFGGIIWADGSLWGSILTQNSLPAGAPADSWDKLFKFDLSGLSGQRPVAEAAPYEDTYNGGRWNVQIVTFTALGQSIHDPDGDGKVNFELTSNEMVMHHAMLGHLTYAPAGVYFSCPLVPVK